MATKIFTAVMHCTKKQYNKVIALGIKIRDGLYAKPLVFPAPPVVKADFNTQLDSAIDAQGVVKGGGKAATTKRNTEVGKLFTMLDDKLLTFVNGLFKGDKDNLLLSGFDVSLEPVPHSIADAPVIKRIDRGDLPHSAKIFLASTKSPLDTKKESLTYIVQMAEDASNEANFRTVLTSKNSRKLLVPGLTRGREEFFRIAVINAKGQSDWSDPDGFMPS